MFELTPASRPDALMKVIDLLRADPRAEKLDLGIGTYRDDSAQTPVMAAVKQAEVRLNREQATKAYLSPAGDMQFLTRIRELVLPAGRAADSRIAGIQVPGGTGAIRLGAELIKGLRPDAKVILGLPTWPNHEPILSYVGLELTPYPHFDPLAGKLNFNQAVTAISAGRPGDVVLLHACCHNPTGLDFSLDQWRILAEVIRERRLIPFIDVAYQGMGRSLPNDMLGLHAIVERVEEVIIAFSCSKSFGLYRDRTGALLMTTRDPPAASAAQGYLERLARLNWSMPPDHGAAIVGIILDSPDLRKVWTNELGQMQTRVQGLRNQLSDAAEAVGLDLPAIKSGLGMFVLLPVSPEEVARLRTDHAIYMAESGRANIAGLCGDGPERLIAALRAVKENPVRLDRTATAN